MTAATTTAAPVIDPRDLNDLTSFARRGGLGAGVALTDCVAEKPDQLMFMRGDPLILLKDMGETLLASCEGVVGWVEREHVKFDSLAGSSSPAPASASAGLPPRHSSLLPAKRVPVPTLTKDTHATKDVPQTTLTGASPPTTSPSSPSKNDAQLSVKTSARPVSGPFELESPGVEQSGLAFFDRQRLAPVAEKDRENAEDDAESKRESVSSVASSAFGGIGGFMMGTSPSTTMEDGDGGDVSDEDKVEQLEDTPVPSTASTFPDTSATLISPPLRSASLASPTASTHSHSSTRTTSTEWDIYGDYARESMYAPLAHTAKRTSSATNRFSKPLKSPPMFSQSPTSPTYLPPSPITRPHPASFFAPQSPVSAPAPAPPPPPPATKPEELESRPTKVEAPRPETMLEGDRNSGTWSISSDGDHGTFAAARAALERVTAKREMRDQQREDEESRSRSRSVSPDVRIPPVNSPPREQAPSRETSPVGTTAPLRPARRRPIALDMRNGIPELKNVGEKEASPKQEVEKSNPETPKALGRSETASPVEEFTTPAAYGGRSLAMQIRMRIQREKELEDEMVSSPVTPSTAPRTVPTPTSATPSTTVNLSTPRNPTPPRSESTPTPPDVPSEGAKSKSPSPRSVKIHSSPDQISEHIPSPPGSGSSRSPTPSLGRSTTETPIPPSEVIFTPSSPVVDTVPTVMSTSSSDNSLLASPLPVDSPRKCSLPASSPHQQSPSLLVPPARGSTSMPPSPVIALGSGWSPHSPSSPHSIDATRQAVEAATTPSESGKRGRNMTLVGRMEADLSAAKGPVPITFLLGGPGARPIPGPSPIGLGPPPIIGRRTPSPEPRRVTSPSPIDHPSLSDPMLDLKNAPSPFPMMPARSATNPIPPPPAPTHAGPKAGFFPASRPRSRSFSAAVSKAMGKTKREGLPPLVINGNGPSPTPPLPSLAGPPVSSVTSPDTPNAASALPVRKPFMRNFSSPASAISSPSPPTNSPAKSTSTAISTSTSTSSFPPPTASYHSNGSSASLPGAGANLPPPSSARSSNFSFSSKGTKTPRKTSRTLASPVSHKDYEETIQADGMDFELVQPAKKSSLLSPLSPSNLSDAGASDAELQRKNTVKSNVSGLSGSSMGHLAETDEWGFLKSQSPTPEIFQSRASAGDHRSAEQKWLQIIAAPLPSGGVPKKVRKLILESGVPGSLRGKVWAWFMAPQMSARRDGLYHELLDHDKGAENERMDKDIINAFPDHSLFADPTSPGQADLRNILRAFAHFAPAGYKSSMSLLAGMLLIHCVAEDAFWLLSGLVNGALKDYYAKESNGMRVDAAVFAGVLQGSEPKVAKLFRDVGLHPIEFMESWYLQLFLRCLPWPTALRVIDATIAEGPRFLLVASLSIITLSRDRLLALPKNRNDVLAYLKELPQDSLLLPETFMKNCESVKFRDEDLKKMRAAVGNAV